MPTEDKLLDITQVAEILNKSEDWLYRTWPKLPFAFKIGREIRFSMQGVQQWIQQQLEEKTNGTVERV
jgi:predicted DNA-binding transcriptional regulator AlpA